MFEGKKVKLRSFELSDLDNIMKLWFKEGDWLTTKHMNQLLLALYILLLIDIVTFIVVIT